MKKKVLLFSISLVLISILITGLISSDASIKSFMNEKEGELASYCRLINQSIADDYSNGLNPDMERYATAYASEIQMRVTIVSENGTVLGDSMAGKNVSKMGSHSDRAEIKEALETGEGVSSRNSATFGGGYLYVAAPMSVEGKTRIVTRVAMEVDRVAFIRDFVVRTTLLSALVGVLAAVGIALVGAGHIIRPIQTIVAGSEEIARGNYGHRIRVKTGDELEILANTINSMAAELAVSVEEMNRADNIRRDFVANVTHELKTPLTSISGFVETLQDGAAENPEIRGRFLDIIAIEASRLKRLINDILVISDIESGREANTDSDINIREVIENTVETLHPLLEAKAVQVVTEYEYEMYIGGSQDRFQQMMMNLIENAVKYSNDGGIVTVTVKKEENCKKISVTDQGIGIAEEHLPRLFERFYRVDKSRSQKVGGTGLGLAIVKHIAGLFGGEVKVESQLGEGTVFTVILPL